MRNTRADDSKNLFITTGRPDKTINADAYVNSSILEVKDKKRAYEAVQK